jgi:hypothetical protein
MTLAASTYFEHLKAYVNNDYVVHDGAEGKVILTEKYFRPEATKPQKRTIEHYTGDKRKIHLRKFVFAGNDNPDAWLEPNRQLRADPSVRYYHFDEVNGQALANLQNISVQEI